MYTWRKVKLSIFVLLLLRYLTCGNDVVGTVDKYPYLDLVLNEYLDYNVTTKAISQSASSTLGLVIAKCKVIGRVPYNVYSKLYDSLVWPVINYGAAI